MKKSQMILALQNEFKKFKDADVRINYKLDIEEELKDNFKYETYFDELEKNIPLLYWILKTDQEIKEVTLDSIHKRLNDLFLVDPLGIKNSLSSIKEKFEKNITKNFIGYNINAFSKNLIEFSLVPHSYFDEFTAKVNGLFINR